MKNSARQIYQFRRKIIAMTAIAILAMAITGALPATLDLDNGTVKVKADLTMGGAITWISLSASSQNLVNHYDRGREIQQSYYAGQSINRQSEGQAPSWSPWSWNPIQAGDCYGHSPTVLTSSVASGTIYTKAVPLLWDMNNEAAQAIMEQWTWLEGAVIHVRCKLTCQRTDSRWNLVSSHQEMPAVYTISALNNQWTYVGVAPWTSAPLTQIVQSGPPWTYWGLGMAHPGHIERWAANVNSAGWGLGVYYKDAELFIGGLHGSAGGGESSGATAHLAPLRTIALDKNSVLDWQYDLILGTLGEIRAYVYAHPPSSVGPQFWGFDQAGAFEGWTTNTHVSTATVSGGVLSFQITGNDPMLLSPKNLSFPAAANHWLHFRAKNSTTGKTAQLFWTNEYGSYDTTRSISIAISSRDADFKTYHVDLSASRAWVGTVTNVRFDPVGGPTGAYAIDYIAIGTEEKKTITRNGWRLY